MPYRKIPFTFSFLDMAAKLIPEFKDVATESFVIDQKTIEKRLSGKGLQGDFSRTPFHFGPIRVNPEGAIEKSEIRPSSPEELMLLSGLEPAQLCASEADSLIISRMDFLRKIHILYHALLNCSEDLFEVKADENELKLPAPIIAWLKNPEVEDNLTQAKRCLEEYTSLSAAVTWFEAGRERLQAAKPADGQSKKKETKGSHLSLKESQAIFVFATSTHTVEWFQGGATKIPTLTLFENNWLVYYLGFDIATVYRPSVENFQAVPQFREVNENRIRRMPNGQIELLLHYRLKTPPPADSRKMRYAVKVVQEQCVKKENDGFRLTTTRYDVLVDERFWKETLLPAAYYKLAEIKEFKAEDFYGLTPFLTDKQFRKAFCKKMAGRPKAEYEAALPWIDACYKNRPKELAAIKASLYSFDDLLQKSAQEFGGNMSHYSLNTYNAILNGLKSHLFDRPDLWKQYYSSIPLSTRIKNNIRNHKARTFAIGFGIALSITGGALAATGVLAPIGFALFGYGVTLAAPGMVAAVSAACFAAPVVLYGISATIVRGVKWLSRKVKPLFKKRREVTTATAAAAVATVPSGAASTAEHVISAFTQAEEKIPKKAPSNSADIKEKKSEGYKDVKMNHAFLVGMHHACQPSGIPVWDPIPYTEAEIKEVLSGPNTLASVDLPRIDWLFGEREESKLTSRGMMERATKLPDPESLRIYSWMTPTQKIEDPSKGIRRTLGEALENADSLKRLLGKMRTLENSLEEKSPIDTSILDRYIQGEGELYNEMEFRAKVTEIIDWIEAGNKKAGQAKRAYGGDDLELSLEESRAICAFGDSVGRAEPLQGGCVDGVAEECFRIGWLQMSLQLLLEFGFDQTRYLEMMRLKRLPDGRISVTTNLEISEVANNQGELLGRDYETDANPADLSDPNTRLLIQFSCEHVFERTEAEKGSIFTMKPHQQMVRIDETFWQEVLLKRVRDKLEDLVKKNVVFKPMDFFAMIPFLENKEFRELFCKAVSHQPNYAFAFAMKWIEVCYRRDPILEEIKLKLGRGEYTHLSKAKLIIGRPTSELPSIASNEYVGYLYEDKDIAENFCTAFSNEMAQLERGPYDRVMRDIEYYKKIWGNNQKNFMARIAITRTAKVGQENTNKGDSALKPAQQRVPK